MNKLVVLTLLATVVATEAVPRWSRRSRSYKPVEYKAPAPAYTDDYVKPVYTDDYAKTSYDYSPKPYKFEYAVKDEYSYNDYAHQQESDGKVVTGSYRVLLPDGRTQIVTYKADEYGYVADVKYEGEAKPYEYTKPAAYPSYSKPAYEPEPYAKSAAYPNPAAYEPQPYVKPEAYNKSDAYDSAELSYPKPTYKSPEYKIPDYKPSAYTKY